MSNDTVRQQFDRGLMAQHKLTLLLLLGYNAIDFIGIGDVQLRPFCHLLKVWTFIQRTAESGLPCCRLSPVPFLKLAFKHSPSLRRERSINEI